MLLKAAQLVDLPNGTTRIADLRISGGTIDGIGKLAPNDAERVIDADGNAVLPGLHDHHVHFLSYAASLTSVHCGPPVVNTERELKNALALARGEGWLRGYGYHESVAGEIDRTWLDHHGPDRPIRLQHRTGRLWIVNSAAIAILRQASKTELTREQRSVVLVPDGRIFDADELLRTLLKPDLSMALEASDRLAAFGVTGVNDMTPSNSPETFALFARLITDGNIKQTIRLSGTPALSTLRDMPGLCIGSTKVHLHEAQLPPFDDLCEAITTSHANSRGIAVHCVTEAELAFALAAFSAAGSIAGDRIEHASVTPPALVTRLRELQLTVVTQPGFVFERGDAYLRDLPQEQHTWLYRLGTFIAEAVPLAFSTDMPFGNANPWQAMQAAVRRLTATGKLLGGDECVTPEFAVSAFLGDFDEITRPRHVHEGARADLCLLDRPWQSARSDLAAVQVNATILGGKLIHSIH